MVGALLLLLLLLETNWRASAKLLLVAEAKKDEIEDTMRLLEPYLVQWK